MVILKLPKNWRCGNTPRLWSGHHYPVSKPDKDTIRKENIPCTNYWQNIRKINSAAHLKDHTPYSSEIHPWDIKMFQPMQTNKCDTSTE